MNLSNHFDTTWLYTLSSASFAVQAVMLILLGISLVSWGYIFVKWSMLRRASHHANKVAARLAQSEHQADNFERLCNTVSAIDGEGMASFFSIAYREYHQHQQQPILSTQEVLNRLQRAFRANYHRLVDQLEGGLPFLASVGSVSPYIGLFGTVWGIMHAFSGLSHAEQVTLSQVAPGIAEALTATAMGLFAAIPAVLAYNHFANMVDRLATRYENLMEELTNLVQHTLAQ